MIKIITFTDWVAMTPFTEQDKYTGIIDAEEPLTDGTYWYFIEGAICSREMFWEEMYDRYKGTEYEGEVLANLLALSDT